MKRLFVLVILLFLTCGPEPIPDPEPALLILPDNLNACNTATRVNNFQRQVRFQWAAGLHTDSYELVVVNNLTGQKETTSTSLIVLPFGAFGIFFKIIELFSISVSSLFFSSKK